MRLKVSAVQFKKTNTASAADNANSSLDIRIYSARNTSYPSETRYVPLIHSEHAK